MQLLKISPIALLLALSVGCGGSNASEPPPVAAPEPPPAESAPEPAASAEPPAAEPEKPAPPPEPVVIEIPLEAKSKSKLTGTAKFSEEPDGVKVVLELKNLKAGTLATHIHEKGDCSAPDGASAGGHFNPDSHPHAKPPDDPRHLGDLGNITIAKDGTGTLEIVVKGANLKKGDPHSFLDRAIIVHEKKDDGGQPTGNAGGRIGCGVIKAS